MIRSFNEKSPNIDKESFIAENASIIGDVTISKDASIWYGAVLRGDTNSIYIGKGSNVQDNCTIHVNDDQSPVIIGENVTVGHNVVLHGAKVGDNTIIGMGSIILDDAEIGENTIVGAGSLVTSGKKIPSGVLCVGSPAKIVRELTENEKNGLKKSAEHYVHISKEYLGTLK